MIGICSHCTGCRCDEKAVWGHVSACSLHEHQDRSCCFVVVVLLFFFLKGTICFDLSLLLFLFFLFFSLLLPMLTAKHKRSRPSCMRGLGFLNPHAYMCTQMYRRERNELHSVIISMTAFCCCIIIMHLPRPSSLHPDDSFLFLFAISQEAPPLPSPEILPLKP